MISRLTKIQLVIFAVITVVGGAFVGGRYAQIDRYFVDRTYTVTMDLERSGSIFTNAEVTYRGVGVGRVGDLSFTDDGVEVELRIENDAPDIPADTEAVVANKSAVGEQFVDLRPRSAGEPFLADGDRIARQNTAVPIQTHEFVIDVADLLASVDAENLNTVVTELGTAFEGTGDDLSQIARTTTQFIDTASENLDLTRNLIRTSNSVLQTQIDSGDSIRAFSRDLQLFTDTLAGADPDLRQLVDEGPAAARVLEETIAENHDDLTQILNELRTATYPLSQNVLGLRAMMGLFPYIVEGGFAVPTEIDGRSNADCERSWGTANECRYDAHFGLVLPSPLDPEQKVEKCREGYPISDEGRTRSPHEIRTRDGVQRNLDDRAVEVTSDCARPELVPRTPRSTIIDGRNAYDIPRAPVAGTQPYDGRVMPQSAEGVGPWNGSTTDRPE